MKLSYNWLSDYIDLEGITAQDLADKFTMNAFEVESVHRFGAALSGPIVVGEILAIEPHPNADKIRLTKTRIKPGGAPLEIVCGAANIQVGQKVPVALPGSIVVNRKDGKPMPIVVSTIRGVQSNGMLCAPSELGVTVSGAADGILILPQDDRQFVLGEDVISLLHIFDYVLHVEPRSNRGDALSVIGLAREAAALFQRPLKAPPWSLPTESSGDSAQPGADFQVTIESFDDCPFFSARIIDKVSTGALPISMIRRLEAIDVRSVSGIVDITNYVMHELGQPLHAYDFDRLPGKILSARRARKDEIINTLDGKKRQLTPEILVIADHSGPAGSPIMGGKNTEISEETQTIVLEAAAFNPALVRKNSRMLGLSSESSLHFERGVDVAGAVNASNRAAFLILKYCSAPGKNAALGRLVTAGSDIVEPLAVTLRLRQLKRLIDQEFTGDEVKQLITPLGFAVEPCRQGEASRALEPSITVSVPSFRRQDIMREIDLIEEVCRMWGYDKVEAKMPSSTLAATPPDKTAALVKETLSACGLNEAWLSSLISPDSHEHMTGATGDRDGKPINVLKPLSPEHSTLRTSLLPGLIKACAYNQARGRDKVWLFESGRIYKRSDAGQFGTGVQETNMVSGILAGADLAGAAAADAVAAIGARSELLLNSGFYAAKGIVENLFVRLHINESLIVWEQAQTTPDYAHPFHCSLIKVDQIKSSGAAVVGMLGELHPQRANRAGLRGPIYFFELNLDLLQDLRSVPTFKELLNAPPIVRDLTIDLDESVAYAAIHKLVTNEAGANLVALNLLSTFKPSPKSKSLSLRLRFQDARRTLTAEEVDEILDKVRLSLSASLSATFRA